MNKSRPKFDLSRRAAIHGPKRKFILFCEDTLASPDYFTELQRICGRTIIEIEVIRGAGVPITIADLASERANEEGLNPGSRLKKSSFEEMDEVWAIFDVDDHCRLPEAKEKCATNGVSVAVSNPCFELWLILHFEQYDRADDRKAIQKRLRNLDPSYHPRKRKTLNCSELINRIDDAEARAEELDNRREDEGNRNGAPSTTVYKLTQKIRSTAGQHLPAKAAASLPKLQTASRHHKKKDA